MNTARVLITGGAGAIGSNLAATLLTRGHETVVLDDLSSGERSLVPPGAIFIEGSITDDAALARAFEPAPDYVIHAAALFANQNSVEHPDRDLVVNGLGTIKVLERCVAAQARKVLFCSSSCVYGDKAMMREDDLDLHPDTPYAITKWLGERYVRFWVEHHGLNIVVVRLFNVYGPHEYPGPYRNVVPNFFKLAMAGESLTITGTGEETRDFTFMADAVSGILAALFAAAVPGDVFNIGSGRETRLIELAQKITELTGNPAPIRFAPRRSWDHVIHRRSDMTRARRALGFEPAVSLDEGLGLTYEWLKSVRGRF